MIGSGPGFPVPGPAPRTVPLLSVCTVLGDTNGKG